MEAAPVLYAVDEKVLVGNNEHQAFVARPVRAGDDTVLVRWESTKKEEEVAIGDVKKIDLDAKRPRRKRRDASGAEAAAPARREPPGKRRKKKADADDDESSSVDTTPSVAAIRAEYQREQEAARAAASDAEDDDSIEEYEASLPPRLREEIDQRMKALQFADRTTRPGVVKALEKLADASHRNHRRHINTSTAIARRLVRLASSKTANQEAAAEAIASLADKSWPNSEAIWAVGGIEALVALVRSGAAGGQVHAAEALASLAQRGRLACDHAICTAIVAAGAIAALVELLRSGAADGQKAAEDALVELTEADNANCTPIAQRFVGLLSGGSAEDQEQAARVLTRLAYEDIVNEPVREPVNGVAIAAAGGIEALVALVRNGADRVQYQAAWALQNLACDNAANKAAIIAAGGVEALVALQMNGSDRSKSNAQRALSNLPLAEFISRLQTENASLQRRLDRYEGSGAIDVTQDDDADDDAQHRDTGLSDLLDRKTQEHIVEVKKEKLDAEGARDRNDAVAAAASTAAATAAADAREAAREAAQELVDVHDDFVIPLTLTVNALQTKIDELHALAYQVDPVAADAIKNRQN